MESSDRFARASARINLEQCRKQAKDLVKAFKRSDERALRTVRANHPRFRGKTHAEFLQQAFVLADAQLVVARLHHIESWPRLLEYGDALDRKDPAVSRFENAVDAIVTGNTSALRDILLDSPAIIHQRSTRAHASTLLHYVSANGVEDYRQVTPANILDVARTLLDAGAEVDAESGAYGGGSTTLGLTATSAHPRLAGVQLALMDLLIDRGAVIGTISARTGMVRDALANGCPAAAVHLIERGSTEDSLLGAAGLGRIEAVGALFAKASAEERADAMLIAAQANHVAVVELLLARGVSVHAFNGMTVLHWAAANCSRDLMRVLLDRGALLETQNDFGGTVLDSTLWFAFNATDIEFAGRDFPGTIDWLIAAGARTDRYPTMLEDIEGVQRRARR